MTITRVKPSGWAVGSTLASSEVNALDVNQTRALDKISGDVLLGPVTLTGAGRMIPSVTVGPNADTTITVGASNTVYQLTSAITAARSYSLSATGAATGDIVTVFADASLTQSVTVKDQSSNSLFEIGNADSNDGPWASFIYMGGWRVYQASQGARMRAVEFTTSTTWTCPRGVTRLLAFGYGGGSAGGNGYNIPTSYNGGTGGAGGGGSVGFWQNLIVVPNTTYTVTVGTGGVAGGNTNGGTTTLTASGSTIAAFNGAYGAGNGFASTSIGTDSRPPPGAPTPFANANLYSQGSISGSYFQNSLSFAPGLGGLPGILYPSDGTTFSQTPGFAGNNNQSERGTVNYGGAAGSTTSGNFIGAGGGGGGGAGPGGNGGAGGNQGASLGAAGGNGSSASANSGAGGGGGGGCRQSTAGTGGNGGSGKLTIFYVK